MSTSDIAPWLEQCRSGDPDRQQEAIRKLVELDARASVPVLVEASRSPDEWVRSAAAEALGRLGASDVATAGEALLSLLGDPEYMVRSDAVEALADLKYSPSVERIKALLLTDPEPLARACAAETLGDLGDASALPELELALRDSDNAVRGYAADSIGLLGSPALLAELQAYLEAETAPEVRGNLHAARYRLGSRSDLDGLLTLIEAASQDMAVNFLNALHFLSSREAPPYLLDDAAPIRAAVTALSQRFPILSGDAGRILAHLAALETRARAADDSSEQRH